MNAVPSWPHLGSLTTPGSDCPTSSWSGGTGRGTKTTPRPAPSQWSSSSPTSSSGRDTKSSKWRPSRSLTRGSLPSGSEMYCWSTRMPRIFDRYKIIYSTFDQLLHQKKGQFCAWLSNSPWTIQRAVLCVIHYVFNFKTFITAGALKIRSTWNTQSFPYPLH